MLIAEFEEKQYEYGLQRELAGSSLDFFPSGQALEAAVGYDFALLPGRESIWEFLHAAMPPGILLTPSLWIGNRPPHARLPDRLVSLIIQAKRPQLLNHWRAGQYHYWRGPYFRFKLECRQQRVLEQLESSLQEKALVRYASPAFIENRALYGYQRRNEIAEHSTFVSPGRLSGHRCWSYDEPGISGYANPEGESMSADTRDSLLGLAESLAVHQTLAAHFHDLASRIQEGLRPPQFDKSPWPPFEDAEWPGIELLLELDLPEAALTTVIAWARVASVIAITGGSWLILGFPDRSSDR